MNTEEKKLSFFQRVDWKKYTIIFVLILVAILCQIIVPNGTFLSSRNLSNLFRQLSITGVIAVGMMLMIVSGNFDLAVGSIVALVGGFAALLQVNLGLSTAVVIPLSLVFGAILGAWQGMWVAYAGVPSYIVTLGDQLMFRGIYLTITKGITITPMHEDFENIMITYISKPVGIAFGAIAALIFIYSIIANRKSQRKYNLKVDSIALTIVKCVIAVVLIGAFVFEMNDYMGIPLGVMILIAVAVVFHFVSTKTRFARRVYAIGGNREAAKLSGIKVERHVMILYILSGVLSGLSAILLTSRLNAAVAAAGTGYETDAISSVVVGGTSLSGGKGTVAGAITGALLVACLTNAMSLLNIDSYVQNIVKGLVLILAVWFDCVSHRKEG